SRHFQCNELAPTLIVMCRVKLLQVTTLMPDRDERLMEQVAQGKRECLEPLVRRHANALLTFIQRMVGDRHRSEELFQEVFLAVWRKRAQYQSPRPFKAWLFGIALNKCRE